MNISEIKINGYHYNPDMGSKVNSFFFDKDDNEDCWVEIIPDSFFPDVKIVLVVQDCETAKAFAYSDDDLENFLNDSIKTLEA